MEVQVIDAEHLAGSRECGAYTVSGVGEDSIVKSWHGLDIGHSFWRQIAPYVIADLVARIFHIAHHGARSMPVSCWLIVRPKDAHDFLLPPRAENGERYNPLHRQRARSARVDVGEMRHEPVDFFDCRATVA